MLLLALALAEEPRRTRHLAFSAEYAVRPEALWPWVTDPDKLSAWNAVDISVVHPAEDGDPSGVGSVREVRVPVGPVHSRNRETVLESDAPHRFVYSVTKGGGLRYHRGVIALEALDEGTRLSWDVSFSTRVPGMGLLVEALLRPQFEEALEALRAQL